MLFLSIVGALTLALIVICIIVKGLEFMLLTTVRSLAKTEQLRCFYLDLMDTWSKRVWKHKNRPVITTATRQVRRKIARQLAWNQV